MTDQELKARLAQAVTKAAPNDLEAVLSRCGTQQKEGMKDMTNTEKKAPRRKAPRWRALVAACLALVLLGGGTGIFYQQANAVASVVSIDVNPSIELTVNKDERVLSCTPLNEDAKIVLEEMNGGKDLEGAKLTVAVNAIVGALVRHGYLDGLSNAILVSVEDKDQARAARMEEELRSSILGLLEAQAPNTTILSQTLPQTQEAGYSPYGQQEENRGHPISSGKAALVSQVMALGGRTSDSDFEILAALTVEELSDLLTTGETRLPIGCAAASWAAQEYAGTLVLNSVVTTDVDPELDKKPAYYEVELEGNFGKFVYKVDAFTGEILSGTPDVLFSVGQDPNGSIVGGFEPTTPPVPSTTPAPVTTPVPTTTTQPSPAKALIGEDAAWSYVCAHAGCGLGDISYSTCELDYEDGVPECYELEFCWNGNQYEYDIDCYTGTVLKHEWEHCDEEHHAHHSTLPAPSGTTLIGEDAAWSYVCAHAGCAVGNISYSTCELDYEDGAPHCYELEFCWNGNQYEYEIDCYSGAVLSHEWEACHNGLHGCGGGGRHHGGNHH